MTVHCVSNAIYNIYVDKEATGEFTKRVRQMQSQLFLCRELGRKCIQCDKQLRRHLPTPFLEFPCSRMQACKFNNCVTHILFHVIHIWVPTEQLFLCARQIARRDRSSVRYHVACSLYLVVLCLYGGTQCQIRPMPHNLQFFEKRNKRKMFCILNQ